MKKIYFDITNPKEDWKWKCICNALEFEAVSDTSEGLYLAIHEQIKISFSKEEIKEWFIIFRHRLNGEY